MFTKKELDYLIESLCGYKEYGHKHWRDCIEYARMNKQEHSINFFTNMVKEMDSLHQSLSEKLHGLKDQLKREEEEKKHDK